VRISQRLLEQYDKEMTIVLQHRFWDLKVTDTGFEVGLSFDERPEMLSVPFSALKGFFDPSVPFGLQFDLERERAGAALPAVSAPTEQPKEAPGEKVVSLDAFRKKP
jgi:hypothetical protein